MKLNRSSRESSREHTSIGSLTLPLNKDQIQDRKQVSDLLRGLLSRAARKTLKDKKDPVTLLELSLPLLDVAIGDNPQQIADSIMNREEIQDGISRNLQYQPESSDEKTPDLLSDLVSMILG